MALKHKKGSLELSINAIVVLILAITLLGLGLGFIKSQFGKVTSQLGSVSSEMESLVREKIESSGDLVAWPETRFELVTGQPKKLVMGVKNTATSKQCFYISFKCDNAVSGSCTDMQESGKVGWDWFNTITAFALEPGEVKVLPVTAQAGAATKDTYIAKVLVYKESPATDGTCPGTAPTLHDKKEFNIELK